MMRLSVLALISLSLAVVALPAMAKIDVDPTGTWNIEITAPDGTTKHRVATFTKEEDSFKGSLYNPDRDLTLDLAVVTNASDNEVRFTLIFQGYSVAYAGNIKGSYMSGRVYYEINGRKFDTAFSASRQTDSSELAGTWDSTLNSNGRARNNQLTIRLERDGTLSGTIEGQGQTSELQDIKLENGVVTFKKPGSQRPNLSHNYRGQIDDDEISGEMIVNGTPAGQGEEFSWSAKKVD